MKFLWTKRTYKKLTDITWKKIGLGRILLVSLLCMTAFQAPLGIPTTLRRGARSPRPVGFSLRDFWILWREVISVMMSTWFVLCHVYRIEYHAGTKKTNQRVIHRAISSTNIPTLRWVFEIYPNGKAHASQTEYPDAIHERFTDVTLINSLLSG